MTVSTLDPMPCDVSNAIISAFSSAALHAMVERLADDIGMERARAKAILLNRTVDCTLDEMGAIAYGLKMKWAIKES